VDRLVEQREVEGHPPTPIRWGEVPDPLSGPHRFGRGGFQSTDASP
jgi:hypothetical protein